MCFAGGSITAGILAVKIIPAAITVLIFFTLLGILFYFLWKKKAPLQLCACCQKAEPQHQVFDNNTDNSTSSPKRSTSSQSLLNGNIKAPLNNNKNVVNLHDYRDCHFHSYQDGCQCSPGSVCYVGGVKVTWVKSGQSADKPRQKCAKCSCMITTEGCSVPITGTNTVAAVPNVTITGPQPINLEDKCHTCQCDT